jgi:hypothetical protein
MLAIAASTLQLKGGDTSVALAAPTAATVAGALTPDERFVGTPHWTRMR